LRHNIAGSKGRKLNPLELPTALAGNDQRIQSTGGTMATKPMPNEELVEVFDTQEESEAQVVRGLLETAGIDALITGLDAPQDVLPGVGGVVIRVPAEQAEEARRMIDEYRTQGEVSEDESSDETPPGEPA
jgi:hypothetical protein